MKILSENVSAAVNWFKKSSDDVLTTVTLMPEDGVIERQTESKLSRVVFHLTNLPNFLDLRGGEIELRADGWQITVTPVPNLEKQVKKLKQLGGYSITHVGEIRREDNGIFDLKDASDLLTALGDFFSFIRGFWVKPLLPIGYNSKDSVVWEQWSMKEIDSWRDVLSWLSKMHGSSIQDLFPGFWSKWRDKVWHDSICTAIYWYVRSNDGGRGIDASIILAQAALERLCWTVYVETNGGLSKAGFKRLPAADQLRLLLARAGIPLGIPNELQELRKLARQRNWDGADAFVNLRNSLVHPGHSNEADFYTGKVGREAWLLSMWYLELILLHLFDYNGVYFLRLKPNSWVGNVENVPWLNSD